MRKIVHVFIINVNMVHVKMHMKSKWNFHYAAVALQNYKTV